VGYDVVIRRRWVLAASNNFAFKIAAKPLQIETWLLLTAYRNSLSPYPTVLRCVLIFFLKITLFSA